MIAVRVRLHGFRELGQASPFRFPAGFDGFEVVLLFSIFVRAIIEELRIDLHEQFHSIVHHTMNCSSSKLALSLVQDFERY